MSSLKVKITDDQGNELKDGRFEKTERYGQAVGKLANDALSKAKPIELTPFQVKHRDVYLPVDNQLYLAGRQLKVLQREAFLWTGDSAKPGEATTEVGTNKRICMKTEVGWLRLGQLDVAAIPGEIYPELVLDKVADPAPQGA